MRFFSVPLRLPGLIAGLIVCAMALPYALAPVYQFAEPTPFSGPYLINPYQLMDSTAWRKYNFQVQSKAWLGLTNGRKNSNMLIDSMYRLLQFDYVATSDYQRINLHRSNEPKYIPTYEHGYGFRKTHQVCIGASKVLWTDYPFFQRLSHKQHILNLLHDECALVALAHPHLLGGYSLEDVKYLSNYQLMEVLNNLRISIDFWDTALSNGHKVYLLSNDDAHDVTNSNQVGRRFTMINAPNTDREEIVASLKNGLAYGFDFYRVDDEPWQDKIERSKKIPWLKKASLNGNRYTVMLSKPAHKIRFIGQHGRLLHEVEHWFEASYQISETDTYVRVEVLFYDSSVMYLNPVIRSETPEYKDKSLASVDGLSTFVLRVSSLLIFITLLLAGFRYNKHS